MNIEQKIRSIISENVGTVDANKIIIDATFFDSTLDSLDVATILLEVQEEFGVEVPEGRDEDYDTIQKLVALVEGSKGD